MPKNSANAPVATASRSAVLTPAATASRVAASAAVTTSPAARIFSICSGVLYSISSARRRQNI